MVYCGRDFEYIIHFLLQVLKRFIKQLHLLLLIQNIIFDFLVLTNQN